jgi:hypothetical protein
MAWWRLGRKLGRWRLWVPYIYPHWRWLCLHFSRYMAMIWFFGCNPSTILEPTMMALLAWFSSWRCHRGDLYGVSTFLIHARLFVGDFPTSLWRLCVSEHLSYDLSM